MMKMLIEMDDDKIRREGKYSADKISAYLSEAMNKRNMKIDSEGWYAGGNFTTCGSLILKLSRKPWFMDNVKEWLWLDTDDSSIEDLKEHYGSELISG